MELHQKLVKVLKEEGPQPSGPELMKDIYKHYEPNHGQIISSSDETIESDSEAEPTTPVKEEDEDKFLEEQ